MEEVPIESIRTGDLITKDPADVYPFMIRGAEQDELIFYVGIFLVDSVRVRPPLENDPGDIVLKGSSAEDCYVRRLGKTVWRASHQSPVTYYTLWIRYSTEEGDTPWYPRRSYPERFFSYYGLSLDHPTLFEGRLTQGFPIGVNPNLLT